jgi:hypothetical protein
MMELMGVGREEGGGGWGEQCDAECGVRLSLEVGVVQRYQSKTICEHKNVSYEAHLCPIIAKVQRAPNAQVTLQIVDRQHEELKSSRSDSQTPKKAF